MAANLLSLLRLVLLPFILYGLKRDGESCSLSTFSLMLAAIFTDLLDGWVARHFGQISRLGQILDPLADKLCLGSVATALVFWRDFPPWLLLMLLARDASIVAVGFLLLRYRGLVISANYPGKYTSTCLAATIVGYAVGLPPAINQSLVAASALLLIVSSLSYLNLLRQTLAAPNRG